MNQSEKFALVRQSALDCVNLPLDAKQVDSGTYAFNTPNGVAKITVTAVRDSKYDVDAEAKAYADDRAIAEEKAEKRKADAEIKRNK